MCCTVQLQQELVQRVCSRGQRSRVPDPVLGLWERGMGSKPPSTTNPPYCIGGTCIYIVYTCTCIRLYHVQLTLYYSYTSTLYIHACTLCMCIYNVHLHVHVHVHVHVHIQMYCTCMSVFSYHSKLYAVHLVWKKQVSFSLSVSCDVM